MNLEKKVKSLPNSPGIYKYLDANGRLLYIGKAKDLKKRVKSYFAFTPFGPSSKLSTRISIMISNTSFLEYIIVESEQDALILENSLIKQLKPKFNILLRDDKTYPYIYIDTKQDFPRLEITRKAIKQKGIKYFGPFSSGANELLSCIYDTHNLIQRKSCIKGTKACLFHQINRCEAPCEDKILKEDYNVILQNAISDLQNKNNLINKLKEQMNKYSEVQKYEEAIKTRDKINKISNMKNHSSIDLANNENLDVFSFGFNENSFCVVKLFIRDGKIISSDYIKNRFQINHIKSNIYYRVLIEHYSKDIPILPSQILVSSEFEEINEIDEFIHKKYDKKIKIIVPQKGIKKKLIELGIKNTKEHLKTKPSDTLLTNIQEKFQLQNIPDTIEVFDNSHMMGSSPVGACVFWSDGWQKSHYRHYNLESTDEYAQMKETLKRRIESFEKNSPPSLWVLDGGLTLLKLAFNLLESAGIYIDLLAISKEKVDNKANRSKSKANDIIYTIENKYKLQTRDENLLFIQRLRDEAHRFAITFHKKQKQKVDMNISLLEKKGISKKRIQKLINYFGTFENIKKASPEEIKSVIGIEIKEL
ncbi:MAG: Excinuclease ABC subunit C [uncultured Campylobacterales bacterium]|uniref:UvrABC system protein C n=1 Tax=uncultured Campylobacterales bacterium TaxID=352960 RepID=A0A6S6S5F8_9BACT|nr:MAG: Excinuclease ABC subunit C [uncultured Campylobacterales bacterium]